MKTKIHAIAGVIGLLTITVFWTSTLFTELVGSHEAIATVKNAILWGMIILIPALAITGGSGMSLGQGRTDQGVLVKKKRMPFIALNGFLVLLPSAIFLATKANAGEIDTTFYLVQGIELLFGTINLTLMGMNMRDGLRLTGRIGGAATGSTEGSSSIEFRQNGPVMVSDLENLVGTDGETIPTKPTMALCRCGASENKPFCDGSHTSTNFSDAKLSDRTTDELLSYEGGEITIKYNRLLCSTAHECGDRLNKVFDTDRDPWIDPNQGAVTEIIDVVRACPSGALSYELNGAPVRHEVAQDSIISVESNGPLNVRNVSLTGEEWCTGACETKYALCRCGVSKNKPFCDGSHRASGFSD